MSSPLEHEDIQALVFTGYPKLPGAVFELMKVRDLELARRVFAVMGAPHPASVGTPEMIDYVAARLDLQAINQHVRPRIVSRLKAGGEMEA